MVPNGEYEDKYFGKYLETNTVNFFMYLNTNTISTNIFVFENTNTCIWTQPWIAHDALDRFVQAHDAHDALNQFIQAHDAHYAHDAPARFAQSQKHTMHAMPWVY